MIFSKIGISAAKMFSSRAQDLIVAEKLIALSQSAKHRNLEFNLSFETVKNLLEQKYCFYTGVKLSDGGAKQGEPPASTQRTIDRVDNSKGYIEGNVVASSVDINQKKGNLTLEEIELLYDKTRQRTAIKRKSLFGGFIEFIWAAKSKNT
jgi:hypothetical protein